MTMTMFLVILFLLIVRRKYIFTYFSYIIYILHYTKKSSNQQQQIKERNENTVYGMKVSENTFVYGFDIIAIAI